MSTYQTSPETRLAPTKDLLDFLGVSHCKFVFRRLRGAKMDTWQDRKSLRDSGSMLYVVEYSIGKEPVWTEIPGVKAFAPLWDPAGKRIVFNTTFMESDIFVLPVDTFEPVQVGFGAHPHWWIDPKTGRSHIVYRTMNGMYTGFPPGKTMRLLLNEKNIPAGEPEVICPYGFGGGITPDGRYLATGYTHLIVADLKTGEYSQPLGDRQLPDGENQVCDVSVSPDDSRRTMHLRITEHGKGRHDFFGVASFDGAEYTPVWMPDGVEEWQTPEWSTHPDYGTAVATREDKTYDIYIARISDQELFRLTWDGGYGHVHLWIPAGED
jgi:hypothetical protein